MRCVEEHLQHIRATYQGRSYGQEPHLPEQYAGEKLCVILRVL